MWELDSVRISGAAYLTDPQRDTLRPLVRYWCVRYAPFHLSKLRYVEYALWLLAEAFCLLAPIAAVAVPAFRALSPADLICASMIYLTIVGVLSACFFELVGSRSQSRLGLLGAAILLLGASISAAWVQNLGKTVQFALVAAVLLAVTIAVVNFAGSVFTRYIWYPLRRQHVATVPPSCATAVWLWYLSYHVQNATEGWRLASVRRELLEWVSHTAFLLGVALPRAMWMSGYRGSAHAEALRRYQRAANFVREQAWRIADANDRESFERIRDDLADGALALARGDWTLVPQAEERSKASWAFIVARRLVTPILLISVALLLPHLPDVRLTGSALTSLQAALILAGVLSLSPLETSSREQVHDLFNDSRPRS